MRWLGLLLLPFVVVVGCRDRDGRTGPPAMLDSGGGGTDAGGGGDTGTPPGSDAGGSDAGRPPGGACNVDIKFEASIPSGCDQTWTESGATLSLIATTDDDCGPGSCSFDGSDSGNLWLFPARLHIDLGSLGCNLSNVEIDITDYCGAGCSRAFLLADGFDVGRATNAGSGSLETMTLTPSPTAPPDAIAVSSCEGQVHEIRLR